MIYPMKYISLHLIVGGDILRASSDLILWSHCIASHCMPWPFLFLSTMLLLKVEAFVHVLFAVLQYKYTYKLHCIELLYQLAGLSLILSLQLLVATITNKLSIGRH